jgi:hypothetical protein
MRLRLIALAGLAFGIPAIVWLAFASGHSGEGTYAKPAMVQLGTRWRTDDAKNLATLLASSDAVFVGRVSGLRGQRLEDLSPPNAAEASTSDVVKPPAKRAASLPISVFEVQVTETWKGQLDAGTTVFVEQPGGTTPSSGGGSTRVVLEGDEPMVVGETYLFWFGPTSASRYVTSPFRRLELSSSGRFEPLAGWGHLGALRQLSGLRTADLNRAIAEAAR